MVPRAQPPVDRYLLDIAERTFQESFLPEKARAQTSITLRRRFRGTSKSDLLGTFDIQTDQWLGDGPERERLMNMHSFQIVKPIIRANQSSMVQARVEPLVEPTSNTPAKAGIASIAKGIAKFFCNHPDYWSNNLENQFNQQIQTDFGCWIHQYFDPEAESPINLKIDEYTDMPVEEPGEYACAHCGAGGELFSEQMGHAQNGQIPCFGVKEDGSQCGEMAEILNEPDNSKMGSFLTGQKEIPAGNIVLDVVPSFEIRVDEKYTKNGNIRKARWLEHHFLMEEDDLQAQVPYFRLTAPQEWSYPIKWQYSLESGTDLYLKSWNSSHLSNYRPHEVRRIYLRPKYYRNYRAPSDFVLNRGDGYAATDRAGRPILQIKAGERLIDKFPKGFWFVVSSGQLLPWMEACDLRDEWTYGGFMNDAASVWYQPMSELNELQRTANNLYTIDVQHRESGSIVTTVFDREMFDASDFERNLSPTKEGSMLEPGDDIHRHYATVPPPQMNAAMEGIGFIKSITGDVSGVQPAAQGAPSPNEPYAAQRLQKESSLGLLSPSQQSKAEVKSTATFQYIKGCQKTKPIEWFQHIGTMYGEEWKAQDIEDFLNSNLDLDLRVSYRPGSEIPASLIEQEMKIRQFILDMAQAAVAAQNPSLFKPELISTYAKFANLPYDVENIEADNRLADSRYQKFKSWLEYNSNSNWPREMLVAVAMADPAFAVMPRENHETHIEFYMDHARPLLAAEFPNFPLIDCCLQMIERHEKASVDLAQTQSSNKVEGQAPEIAAQAAAQAAAAQAEAQKQQIAMEQRMQEMKAKAEIESMSLEAKAREGDKDREHDATKHAADVAVKLADIQSREKPQTPEAEDIDPRTEVARSTDYEDLPPNAQAAILRDMDLPSGGTSAVHQATIAAKQIAAAKASRARSSNGGAR